MRTHKAQANTELATMLVGIAVALIVGVLVYGTIAPAISNVVRTNESLGGPFNASTTTACVDFPPILAGSYTAYNSSFDTGTVQNTMTETTDYTLNLRTGCLTNASADVRYVRLTYTTQLLDSQGQTTVDSVNTNTFSAFTLAAIVLIVIAAAAILRNIGMF